jgi:SAM-dependent methyltransferase
MDTALSYSAVASHYASEIFDELQDKPFDRTLLDRLAQLAGPGARVCDLGCGPGQVAAYLSTRGVRPFGLDLSPGMVEEARRRNPGLEFLVGDMRSMPLPAESVAAMAAFYSLIHVPEAGLPAVFAEIRRVLVPGGHLLFSFHLGEETVHLDSWWERPVNLDFHFFRLERVQPLVEAAGFAVEGALERDPYAPEVEHQSRRGYLLARKI